jgi:hypothetical protein
MSEVLLYSLSIADVTMLLALGFVLARNRSSWSSNAGRGLRSRGPL